MAFTLDLPRVADEASEFLSGLSAAERNRLSVPRITCVKCNAHTTRSNLSDDLCDPCYDANPMRVFNSSHGVAWRNGG